MKTQTKRAIVKASDILFTIDILALEVFGMVEDNEAKITARYWSLMFDPFFNVWRKNGFQPLTREEVLRRCRE